MHIQINIRRVLGASALGLLLITCIAASTACVTIEEGDHFCGADPVEVPPIPGVDAGVPETDAPPTEPARLHFQFGGPPSGTELLIGAQNDDVLCYNMSATADVEIRRFRVRVSAQHGFLTIGGIAQLTDIKIVGDLGNVVAGPVDVDGAGNGWTQTFILSDVMTMTAGQTYGFCLQTDVRNNVGLNNEHVAFALMPVEQGDVVLTDGGAELDPAQSDAPAGLTTELVFRAPPASRMSYSRAPDDSDSEAGIVVGGTMVTLAKYRFTAEGESLKLTKVPFRVTNVVFDQSVLHGVMNISLWDGATQVSPSVAPNQAGFANFTGVNFIVPQDGVKTLMVKALLSDVSPTGGDSGINVGVTLCAGNNDGECWNGGPEPQINGTYEVQNLAGAVVDTSGDWNIDGHEKILRRSKPWITVVPTSTSLSNGTKELISFTVTADAAADLSLKTVSFQLFLYDVGGQALAVDEPMIREAGQVFDLPARVSSVSTCVGSTTCAFSLTFASEQVIAAGTSRTFTVRAAVTGADAGNEIVSTHMIGDADQVTDSLAGVGGEAVGLSAYNFIWSDRSATPHNAVVGGSADWTNGRFVKNLPSSSQSLIVN